MNLWIRSLCERPVWVLAAVVLFTLFSLQGIVDLRTGQPRLGIDPSPERVMPAGGPERELYERTRKLFGSDEPLVVGLGAEDVFTPEMLGRIVRMTEEIEGVPLVNRVLSLANAPTIRSVDGDLLVGPILRELPTDSRGAQEVRELVMSNSLFSGTLVSPDGDATLLVVSLDRIEDRELVLSGVVDQVSEVAFREAGSAEVWVSGGPHQKHFLSTFIQDELAFHLPIIFGLLAVVLAIALRSVGGVVLPLLTILISLLWTLGTLGWLGLELNMVTTLVPALILTIGFTYALHVVTEYRAVAREVAEDAKYPAKQAVRLTLEDIGIPILITGVTTAAGFLSLAINPIPAIQQFGLFSLLGVGYTVLASLTFTPAALALLPFRRPRQDPNEGSRGFERVADALSGFSIRHRGAIMVGAGVVLVVSLAGMTQIRINMQYPGNFPEDNPVRRDFEAINARLGGVNELRILLEADAPEALLEPEVLREIESLQEWLESQPEVGATTSIVDYVKLLNRALRDGEPAAFAIPETKRSVSQLLLFGGSRDTQRFVDARYQIGSVMVNVKIGDSEAVAVLVERVEERLQDFPENVEASVTGGLALLSAIVDDLSRGQLLGISMAFVLIYGVLALMFTSFRIGFLALIPNILPIAFYFGILGLTGVAMNPATSLVGCLCLGIAVDDTIHYLARFNAEARKHADEKVAAATTLRALIRPVSFTTVGLCVGFLVLTSSQNSEQVEFGALAALTIFAALVVDVTLNPALCSGVRIVTLWDVLRLDLGPQPHLEIPLFEGLSLRGARVFALMSDIRRMEPGERLLTEGDWGDDMFLILGGELKAWCDRDGKRIDLSTMRRGEVVGEVGYFAYKRTASVDATTEALLIRFDSEDLERLRQRYPRTAAVVFRNLNRIQAKRIVRDIRLIR